MFTSSIETAVHTYSLFKDYLQLISPSQKTIWRSFDVFLSLRRPENIFKWTRAIRQDRCWDCHSSLNANSEDFIISHKPLTILQNRPSRVVVRFNRETQLLHSVQMNQIEKETIHISTIIIQLDVESPGWQDNTFQNKLSFFQTNNKWHT